MGRSESSILHIGIDIMFIDLINSINKDNFEEIRDNFLNGYSLIKDPNEYYNDSYLGIIEGCDPETDEYTDLEKLNHEDYKSFMTDMHLKHLEDEVLLVPHKKIVDSTRWGYNREGTNGDAVDLDLSLLNKLTNEINDKMERLKIEGYTVALIVSHTTY